MLRFRHHLHQRLRRRLRQRLRQRLYLAMLLLFLAACQRSTPTPPVTSPLPAPQAPQVLGTADVDPTVGLLSSQAIVPDISFTLLASSILDGDGIRIRQVTLEVTNDSSRNLSNLTLYSIQTPNTLTGSNVSKLQDALGNPITDPAMAQSIVPVHGQSSLGVIDPDLADMQAFSTADQVRVQALLDAAYPNNSFSVLARGFVASNVTGQADRAIAAGETGVITLALQYPFDASSPAGYPDRFSLSFAFVDEPTTRFTQGDDESNVDFLDRLDGYGLASGSVEVVPAEPGSPPDVSGFTPMPTLVTPAPFSPPIDSAPPTPSDLPDTFTLGVAALIVSADVEVEVSIAAAVTRTLAWE